MAQVLVRNLEAEVVERLKAKARARGTSLEEIAREALRQAVKPMTDELWAEIDSIRERIGPIPGDSTVLIREDRDNDEPCR